MGRRRRRWREPEIVWWLGFLGLIAAAVALRSWRLGLLTLLLWCLYEFCLIPTICRIMSGPTPCCGIPVRGRLFACSRAHQQIKSDALWRLVGMNNPFRRSAAPDPSRPTGVLLVSPLVRGRLGQSDRIILRLAGIGTVVTIVGSLLGLIWA